MSEYIYSLNNKGLEEINIIKKKGTKEYIEASHLYIKSFDSYYYLIIDSYFNYIDLVPKKLIEICDNKIKLNNFLKNTTFSDRYSSPQTQYGLKLIKDNYVKEITETRKNKRLVIYTICPTYSCNMACSYCYQQNYEKDLSTISIETLNNIFSKIEKEIVNIRKQDPLVPIVIELFGGEPLQNKNIGIIEKCLEFARKLNCKVWIVSNGFELYNFAVLFAKFRDIIAQISVTLDGVGEYHNSRRIIKGKDSFAEIVKGIDLFLELDFKITVCTNIDSENVDKIEQIINFVTEKKWGDYEKFKVLVGRVYDRLLDIKYKNVITETTILKSLLDLVGKNKPQWLAIGFLKTTEHLAKKLGISLDQDEYGKASYHYCWSTSPIIDGYYVDNSEYTYRCTTTVANKNYTLGLQKDVQFDSYFKSWNQHNIFYDDQCTQCTIGGFCGGGCLLEKTAYGDEFCKKEKLNFDDFFETLLKPYLRKLLINLSPSETDRYTIKCQSAL